MELQQTLPEKVKLGLEHCTGDGACITCPYNGAYADDNCTGKLMSDALYFIKYMMGETQK